MSTRRSGKKCLPDEVGGLNLDHVQHALLVWNLDQSGGAENDKNVIENMIEKLNKNESSYCKTFKHSL